MSSCSYVYTLISLCCLHCRCKCWEEGTQTSPVDGQWYTVNSTTDTSSLHGKAKGHLSVSLRLPKSITQWKLQHQLQHQMEENPELADVAAEMKDRDTSHARHALQHTADQSQGQQGLQEKLQLLAMRAGGTDVVQQDHRSTMRKPTKAGSRNVVPETQQRQQHKSWHGSMV